MPPIVVAEDRENAERRAQNRQSFRPLFRINRTGHEAMPGVEVAKQKHDVGIERIGDFGDTAYPCGRHLRFARMDIGNQSHFEIKTRRPVWRRQTIICDVETKARFDHAGVGAKARAGQCQGAGALEHVPAGQ